VDYLILCLIGRLVMFKFRYEESGWKPLWMPEADSGASFTVAHDCIEHFPNDDGSVEAELMAFGAMLYVRVIPNWWRLYGITDRGDPINILKGEFSFLMRYVEEREYPVTHLRPRRKLYNDEAEEFLQEWVTAMIRDAKSEMSMGNVYPGDESYNTVFVTDLHQRMVNWLRIGYRRAARRYRKMGHYGACELFDKIHREALEREGMADEGYTEMWITVNNTRETINVRSGWPGDLS